MMDVLGARCTLGPRKHSKPGGPVLESYYYRTAVMVRFYLPYLLSGNHPITVAFQK